MEYSCNRCGALKFSSASALSNHQRSIACFSSQRNLEHTCKRVKSTNPQAFESAQGLQQENLQQEDQFDFDNLVSIPDYPNPPPYDSTFSLVHWIRHCRATIRLSNKDINSLFEKVLFHPSFKLEDVSVSSAAQIDRYEQTIFRTEDGWDQYLIHVTEGDSGDRVMYHKDPLEALSSMFSSPSLKEDFQIAPSNGVHQGVYSTPNTSLWWLQMQVPISLLTFKFSTFGDLSWHS
jgi:hypothetical protein